MCLLLNKETDNALLYSKIILGPQVNRWIARVDSALLLV
jgi:hypothetical protein